jgi:hypothetical protein
MTKESSAEAFAALKQKETHGRHSTAQACTAADPMWENRKEGF